MARVLLSSAFRPFCVDGPYDSSRSQVQHGSCHRQFTREQGIFTIHQQCSHLGLHLIAANIGAEAEVAEYPSVEEFVDLLQQAVAEGRPYDWVGISTVAAYLPKAQRMCELVREHSPGSRTVVGGGGAMAIGPLVDPFCDQVCVGDGVAFFRELLGQDTGAPIEHPAVWSVHFPNEIFSVRANSAAWSIAVALGCDRSCQFCATSAQFGARRQRLVDSGEHLMQAVKGLDQQLRAAGRASKQLQLLIFDENFLSDEPLARGFLEANRRELAAGNLYLPFVFGDARAVQRYTPEELLEMGIDAIWIGMEAADGGKWAKNRDTDFKALVQNLQSHGIKVVVSLIAGMHDQTPEGQRKDAERALELGAAGFQYAMVAPMPGTPYFERMRREGRLNLERLDRINMSHYVLDHPDFDDDSLRAHTTDFHRRDYERHGPMALRYLKLRRSGWRKHKGSPSAALRSRARGFRHDLMDSMAGLTAGRVFAPTAALRKECGELERQLARELSKRVALGEWLRGEISGSSFGRFLVFTSPVAEPIARQWLKVRILRWDPRSRERCDTLWGLLRHGREAIRQVSGGMMPFGQPELVVTRYPRQPATVADAIPSLASRLRRRLDPHAA